MTATTRLDALSIKLGDLVLATTSMGPSVSTPVDDARNAVLGMSSDVPASLTTYYSDFGRQAGTVSAIGKTTGMATANPDICAAVALVASGDFLSKLEALVDTMLSYLTDPDGGLARITAALADLGDRLAEALGLAEMVDDVQAFVNQAETALTQLAQGLGMSQIADALAMQGCLQWASNYTANPGTLLAHQIASGAVLPTESGVKSAVLASTGIATVASDFQLGLQSKLAAFTEI